MERTGQSTPIEVRFRSNQLVAIDAWIARQIYYLSQLATIPRLMATGVENEKRGVLSKSIEIEYELGAVRQ